MKQAAHQAACTRHTHEVCKPVARDGDTRDELLVLRGHLPLLDDEHDEGGRHEREGDTDDEGSKEGTHTLAAGKLLLSKREWMVERLWSHIQHEPAVHNHQCQRMHTLMLADGFPLVYAYTAESIMDRKIGTPWNADELWKYDTSNPTVSFPSMT